MALKALLIDDDPEDRALLSAWFKRRGHALAICPCAKQALAAARAAAPDVILLDVHLHDGDGFQVLAGLKADPALRAVPVIMVSGSSRESRHMVRGLGAGAEDYLVKGFDADLLFAKVAAVLRRAPAGRRTTLAHGGVVMDIKARRVSVDGAAVPLTRKEFDLLAAFLRRAGDVLSARGLLETVWGYDVRDYDDARTVRVHVSSLKRKLGPAFAGRLENVIGAGYRLR